MNYSECVENGLLVDEVTIGGVDYQCYMFLVSFGGERQRFWVCDQCKTVLEGWPSVHVCKKRSK